MSEVQIDDVEDIYVPPWRGMNKFTTIINRLRRKKGDFCIAIASKQRVLMEKQVSSVARFVMTDRRKYATTYYLANSSRVILLHEKLIGPVLKTPISVDVRKWTDDELSKYFTYRAR